MTKSQIWIAVFLGIFLVLFGISKITDKKESDHQSVTYNESESDAVTLISNTGCTSCHGAELTGGPLGPSLHKLQEFWDRDGLISYLRNPDSFMDSDRLGKFKELYPNVMMPSYNNLDVKDLGRIADYLLTLKN